MRVPMNNHYEPDFEPDFFEGELPDTDVYYRARFHDNSVIELVDGDDPRVSTPEPVMLKHTTAFAVKELILEKDMDQDQARQYVENSYLKAETL